MRKSGVQWQKLGKITASRINIRTHFALNYYHCLFTQLIKMKGVVRKNRIEAIPGEKNIS